MDERTNELLKKAREDLTSCPPFSLDDLMRVSAHGIMTGEKGGTRERWARLAMQALDRRQKSSAQISPSLYARRREWARQWSAPQKAAIQSILDPTLRHVVLIGSVRTGKTEAGIAAWLQLIAEQPDYIWGLAVRSLGSLHRVIGMIEEWAHELWWPVTRREQIIEVGPARIRWVIGAHDRSRELIKGDTWAGAFCDEANEMPETLIDEIAARCSVAKAKIISAVNPAEPDHWYKTKIRDKVEAGELSGRQHRFTLTTEECPWLEQEYIDSLEAQYVPGTPLHRWYVLGEDAATSGLVYPRLDEAIDAMPDGILTGWYVSVDAGYSEAATHAVAIAALQEDKPQGLTRYHVAYEWRYKAGVDGPALSYHEQPVLLLDWMSAIGLLDGDTPPPDVMVDNAEIQWTRELARHAKSRRDPIRLVTAAKRRVREGIQSVQAMMSRQGEGQLTVDHNECTELLREMRSLRWNPLRVESRGIEEPTIGDDHGADALRYWADAVENRALKAVDGR